MGSLMRHRDRHLPVTLAHAKEARETEMGENLMEQAKSLHARAFKILERAEAAGQLETALRAIREVRGILELLGKLDGQLEKDSGRGPVNVIVTYVDKQLNLAPVYGKEQVPVHQKPAPQLAQSQRADEGEA